LGRGCLHSGRSTRWNERCVPIWSGSSTSIPRRCAIFKLASNMISPDLDPTHRWFFLNRRRRRSRTRVRVTLTPVPFPHSLPVFPCPKTPPSFRVRPSPHTLPRLPIPQMPHIRRLHLQHRRFLLKRPLTGTGPDSSRLFRQTRAHMRLRLSLTATDLSLCL